MKNASIGTLVGVACCLYLGTAVAGPGEDSAAVILGEPSVLGLIAAGLVVSILYVRGRR